MKRLALGALRRIQKLPELVKSFFANPSINMPLSNISNEKVSISVVQSAVPAPAARHLP